ncbi:MAG: radical SAM/SPASM domain-containing protein [Candidatus Jordarchaeum sp.]|uniref:radical SAM/SPASM domain-containing protein n=1 Tax=Candidatus Jordarchaeum sp. TaxID=2823881 RepID=UPI00404A3000
MDDALEQILITGLRNKINKIKSSNPGSAIPVVSLKITNECNLKCLHCSSDSGLPLHNELTLKEIQNLIDKLSKIGVKRITLSGGEPTIRKDFWDILCYLDNLDIQVSLFTHGFFFNRNFVDRLSNLNVSGVRISIDGGEAETHDKIRGVKGSFSKAVKAVKLCSEAELMIVIVSVIMKNNLPEIKKIIELAEKNHVPAYFRRFHPIGRGLKNIHLMPSAEELKEATSIIGSYYGEDLIREMINYLELVGGWCYIGNRMCIEPDGNVVLCPSLPHVMGNIRKICIEEIWNKIKNSKICDMIQQRKIAGKCSNCSLIKICGGGCRADAYGLTGNILSEDPLCWNQPSETSLPILNALIMASTAFYESSCTDFKKGIERLM